ncbi:G/U mismatch-specific uracil-DNA glycosylase [Burkholderiales bacterium 8X]|nr:G/U mismatch-specific uracil-DNA glycosylase [Burkholderiales bacterium 8X]
MPTTASTPTRLIGLDPIVDSRTRLLILGSFPGARSLECGQYYAHPRNQFWKILQSIWHDLSIPLGDDGQVERASWLRDRGIGLWDVYASCEREGSLDASIRSAALNDIAGLRLPCLEAIAHNGGKSFRHARHTRKVGVPVYSLPSSSPAHAAWSLERKTVAWREVFAKHGLV